MAEHPYGPPAPPGMPHFQAPVGLSDQQLRQLPPPSPPQTEFECSLEPRLPGSNAHSNANQPSGAQRPAVVGLSVCLAVTASLLWVCGLALFWLTVAASADRLDAQGNDGVVFHLLHEADERLRDGLALPLFAFPLLSLVSGFLLLVRRPWPRIAHSAVGAAALAWAAWWLRDGLGWWLPVAAYVAVACLVLWTPSARRWYGSAADEL